jgi:hypothetical protein
MTYLRCVMRRIVAAPSEARHLIRSERIHQCSVNRILLKIASARMTMQALGILECAGNRDRVVGFTHILQIDTRETCELVFHRSTDGVVSVARMYDATRVQSTIEKFQLFMCLFTDSSRRSGVETQGSIGDGFYKLEENKTVQFCTVFTFSAVQYVFFKRAKRRDGSDI